ncbi:MAG: hypothetical protein ACJ79S_15195 [Gemmatimonadaceae bacterium]
MTNIRTSRRAERAVLLVAWLSALGAPAAIAGAQSMPALGAAKRAAQNAAAATNAHTATMTAAQDAPTAAAPRQPSASRPASSGALAAVTPAPAKTAPARTAPAKPGTAGATPAKVAASAPASTGKSAAVPAPATGATPRYAATAGAGATKGGAAASPASVAVTESGAASQLTFSRETFEYGGRGRRDPFVSLMASGELRPLLSDLKLVTVLYDPTGRNSVAIMRDLSTKDQYRVKVGQTLGRMRVSQIQPKQVVFALEEFGYGRQEVLGLTDSTTARKQ